MCVSPYQTPFGIDAYPHNEPVLRSWSSLDRPDDLTADGLVVMLSSLDRPDDLTADGLVVMLCSPCSASGRG